jgi:hypothetical protein
MMMDIQQIYCKSAVLLDEVKDELSSGVVTGSHHEFLSLKFMALVIHNDVCREFHNLVANPTIGISRLLALGPIILKLFEANLWYSQVGNKRLRELAASRGMLESIEHNLREMKLIKPNRIEKYATFRNKLAGHYDDQTLNLIQELGSVQSDKFFEDVEMMVRYSQIWLQALRSIGKLAVP